MNEEAATDATDVLRGLDGRTAYRELLGRNRDFRNLFFAMLTSSLGDWIGVIAILTLTDNILGGTRAAAFGVSVVMIARIVPTLVLGPVAGVFVDRWDRKRTMIVTDVGRGIVMILLAFAGDIWALILATLVIEVMSALFIPAKDSAMPNLVAGRRLVHANQLSLGATYGTFPLGGVISAVLTTLAAGYLASTWGLFGERPVVLPIWFNAATFFLSAAFITRIRSIPVNGRRQREPGSEDEARPGAWQELKEGFRFIAQQPLVRALVVGVMAASLAAGGVIATGEFFAGVVNAGEGGFGVLVAVLGSGLFVGLVGAAPLSQRIAKERLFAPGIAVAGVALVVAALMPRLDLASIPAFVMGMGAGTSFISGYTLLQEKTADEIRGRTFAAFNTGVRMALFVALILAPALVGVIGREGAGTLGPTPYVIGGVRITLIVAGLVALAGAVWTGRAIYDVLSRKEREELASGRTGLPGTFIVFEGGEGAGKSTQIGLLREALEADGHHVLVTREPGGTEVGERIRDLLLDVDADDMTARTEALLYAAARSQHVEEVIRPALEKGMVVLSDRYVDSSIVYQGGARDLGEARIEALNEWGTQGLQPDLVVLLDIEAEAGLARAGAVRDRLESAGLAFHRFVNEGFRKRAAHDPPRYLVLDASRSVGDLHADIRATVLDRLRLRGEGR